MVFHCINVVFCYILEGILSEIGVATVRILDFICLFWTPS